jgi:hypothetical protein
MLIFINQHMIKKLLKSLFERYELNSNLKVLNDLLNFNPLQNNFRF